MRQALLFLILLLIGANADAARLKDIANIRGVRSNQLVGYGVVVGLNGTGDSKSEFTNKSIERMLDRLGVKVQGKDVSTKSVAAVIGHIERLGQEAEMTLYTGEKLPW